MDDFLADYPAALARSEQLDEHIISSATTAGGSKYAELISLVTRQAYGAVELTLARASDGSLNTSDVMMFMKDFGSPLNGVARFVTAHNDLLLE